MQTIQIKCQGAGVLSLAELDNIQGDLKKLSKENLEKLKKNILLNGFIAPIFIWNNGTSNFVLDGNQRTTALKSLEADGYEIPLLPIDYIDAQDEAEARRMLLSITSQYGEFDKGQLDEWLSGIDDEMKDCLSLIDSITDRAKETKNDDEIEEPKESICQTGQIWKLGRHRLLCGDSGKEENIIKLFEGKKPSIVFTDPPYGVSIGDKNRFLDEFQESGRVKTNIENDTKTPEELKKILTPIFSLAKKYCSDDCTFFMTAPQGGELCMMMMMMMGDAGLPIRHVLMWYKNSPTFSLGRLDYDYQHEPILLTWGKKHKRPMNGTHKTSVWKVDKPRSSKEHPTMKPTELYENAYLNNSDKNDIVYEPFAGSGTAFLAAEKTERTCYGVELDPHYCDVIINRYKKWCDENNIQAEVSLIE